MKAGTSRNIRRFLTALLAAVLISAAPAAAVLSATQVTAEAAAKKKQGLRKEKGKYYYYVKGKKVTGKWKTVKVKGKKYKYYFGKSGAAYAGKKSDGFLVPSARKIGKYYYAFDSSAHMIRGLHYIGGKFWYFNSKGRYDAKKTKTIRAQIKKVSGYLDDYRKLKKILAKYGVKPKSTIKEYGCFAMGDVSGMDGLDTYSEFAASYFLGDNGKSYLYSLE